MADPRTEHSSRRPSWGSTRGFTLIEILIVAMVISTLTGMAMIVMPGVIAATKSDSGSVRLTGLLRTAREQSITERRNIEIRFVAPNLLETWRDDVNGDGTPAGQTRIVQTVLEQGVEYVRFDGVADTPDAFGGGVGAVDFTGAGPWRFTTEGQLVDVNGDIVNGTVFVGRPFQRDTARAVTLFGPTALLREWRWNGARWTE